MGQLVSDELLAWPDVQSDGELVCHGARRREEPRLVTQQVRDAILQRSDRRVLAEDIVADLG